MKRIVWLIAPLILSACSGMPSVQSSHAASSFDLGPTNSADVRLRHPQFYRDESDATSWLHDSPRNNE